MNRVDMQEGGSVALSSRFSISKLLVATAMVAVLLAALKYFSLVGLFLVFVAACVSEVAMFRCSYRNHLPASTFLWGFLFPILCVLYDPGIMHEPWYEPFQASGLRFRIPRESLEQWTLRVVVPPMLFQTLAMLSWQFFRVKFRRAAALYSGFLSFGFLLALTIGICIFPATLLGTLFLGIGLLGLVPFLTSAVYLKAAQDAWRSAKGDSMTSSPSRMGFQFGIGFLSAAGIPLGLHFLT